jgi:hypothetical protein
MWTISRRTGFESALLRADRDVARAIEHADAALDYGAVEDLTDLRLELFRLITASQAEGKRKLPRPIPGQTEIAPEL